MRISYKPYLLPTLIFSFMFLSCKSHAELETIITVEQVGAAATPDRIIPIEGAPFEIPQLKRPIFPDFTINIGEKGAKTDVPITSIKQLKKFPKKVAEPLSYLKENGNPDASF